MFFGEVPPQQGSCKIADFVGRGAAKWVSFRVYPEASDMELAMTRAYREKQNAALKGAGTVFGESGNG